MLEFERGLFSHWVARIIRGKIRMRVRLNEMMVTGQVNIILLPEYFLERSVHADLVTAGAGALLRLVVSELVTPHRLAQQTLLSQLPLPPRTVTVHVCRPADVNSVALQWLIGRADARALTAL